ncbi:MAG: hypothetical protein ACODAA_05735 [Gemmatimonadota bacterium]
MRSKTFVVRGDRWIVEEEAPVTNVRAASSGYVSETPAMYRIVFVHAATGRTRSAEWHNPLDMCDIEDLQIMFADSRRSS